jgi:transcriptional regulator with XRE-family HTH domain
MAKIEKNLVPVCDRILRAIEELPANQNRGKKQPKASGVHNTVIKRLIEAESLPSAKNMIKICQATGLSADYFYFGDSAENTRHYGSEMTQPYQSQSPAPVDTDLITQVVIAAEKYLEDHRLKISKERKGVLISLLYEYRVTEKDEITPDIIKANLRLSHLVSK